MWRTSSPWATPPAAWRRFSARWRTWDRTISALLLGAPFAPAAFIFDVLDGRIARMRHEHSALGRELDSLADVISFGVAPAALGFAAGLRGGWDWVILIYFVCCGVSRLARFNVTAESLAEGSEGGKVKYFEGTPIPTSVVLTGVLALEAWRGCVERGALDGGVFAVARGTCTCSRSLRLCPAA
jgi:CDP-diacylglycerol--serine O-phosphatidyltransferase